MPTLRQAHADEASEGGATSTTGPAASSVPSAGAAGVGDERASQHRALRRYDWRDHAQAATKAILEGLAVLPFWAVKMGALTECGRVPGLVPYPHGHPLAALKVLVDAEGVASGLFKGCIPMLTIGVTQALVVAMQRHIRFVRRVELSRSVLAPLGGSIGKSLDQVLLRRST